MPVATSSVRTFGVTPFQRTSWLGGDAHCPFCIYTTRVKNKMPHSYGLRERPRARRDPELTAMSDTLPDDVLLYIALIRSADQRPRYRFRVLPGRPTARPLRSPPVAPR